MYSIMNLPFLILLTVLAACSSCTPEKPQSYRPGKDEPVGGPCTSQVFKQGSDGYNTFRIPAAVKTKEGTILCFAEGRVNSADDFGDIDIVLKRSSDNGKTWSDMIVVAEDGINRCCNPTPVALEDGKVILVYSWNHDATPDNHVIYTVESDDDGLTWKNRTDITSQIALEGEYRHLAGPCHGIVKEREPAKGRIIIPSRCASPARTPVHVFYSDDGGRNWQRGGSVDYQRGNECTVAELTDGGILIDMRNTDGDDFHRWQAVSHDGGMSFDHARQTVLVEPQTGCQGALHRFKWDETTGKALILFSNPNHTSSRRFGSVKLSTDDGRTWNRMYRYTADSGDGIYSSYSDLVTVSPDVVGVIYEAGYKLGQGIVFKSFDFDEITQEYTY